MKAIAHLFVPIHFTTEILWLFGTSLTGTLPTELAELIHLQHLIAFDTMLSGQLPDIFGSLESLQELQLAHASFSGTLPPSLFQLPGIELLSIEENSITGTLPETVTLPAIRTFNLLLVSQGNTFYSDQSYYSHQQSLFVLETKTLQFEVKFPPLGVL